MKQKNLTERIQDRRVVNPIITIANVQGLEITVERIAKGQISKAGSYGRKKMRDEGLEPENLSPQHAMLYTAMEIPDVIKENITGWKTIEEKGELPYTRENLNFLFDVMGDNEKALLGTMYLEQYVGDGTIEKKILLLIIKSLSQRLELALDTSLQDRISSLVTDAPSDSLEKK